MTPVNGHKIKPLPPDKSIMIPHKKLKIALNQLIYIHAEDKYLNLITLERNHVIRGKMYAIIEELPDLFFRCHRSYIVNMEHIHFYQSGKLYMTKGIQIPVSRKHKKTFLLEIQQKISNKIINPKNYIV